MLTGRALLGPCCLLVALAAKLKPDTLDQQHVAAPLTSKKRGPHERLEYGTGPRQPSSQVQRLRVFSDGVRIEDSRHPVEESSAKGHLALKRSDSSTLLERKVDVAHVHAPLSTRLVVDGTYTSRRLTLASLVEFTVGILTIFVSLSVLWVNENRYAQRECIIDWGQEQCRAVNGHAPDPQNRNCLVHLQGEQIRGVAKVCDPQFHIGFERSCIRLESFVEVFQYIQKEKVEEREKFGGGKDVVTTFHYTCEWSSRWHDSQNFEDPSKVNHKPHGLELGSHRTNCSRVECGHGFLLPEGLVSQCREFISAERFLDSQVRTMHGVTFEKQSGGIFYYHMDGNQARLESKVGDARVRFDYVPDGPISLLALQVEKAGEARDTFLPYRLTGGSWLTGSGEEDEKIALRQKAELSKSDLALQTMGPWSCLCQPCVAFCSWTECLEQFTPEIYDLFHGSKGQAECFQGVAERMQLLVWGFRLMGSLLLFAGLYLLLEPFLASITVLPVLGTLSVKLGTWLLCVLCFIVTVATVCLIIALAYLLYRPLVALLYVIGAAAAVVLPLAFIHAAA